MYIFSKFLGIILFIIGAVTIFVIGTGITNIVVQNTVKELPQWFEYLLYFGIGTLIYYPIRWLYKELFLNDIKR